MKFRRSSSFTMFRLVVVCIVLCSFVYSLENEPKHCPFGFEIKNDGCKTCECHDPCKSLTQLHPCQENEECKVETSPTGEFIPKCEKKVEKRDIKGRCALPKTTGPCRRAVPRYFYDATKRQCESFIYGGCKGNANNFPSKRACEAACH